MNEPAPFHTCRSGTASACGDGPELLVYSGSDDRPLWKAFCSGILVGVGATPEQVIAVDSEGRITFFRTRDGQVVHEAAVDGPVTVAVVDPGGRCAIGTPHQVQLATARGSYGRTAVREPSALGFGEDGQIVGIGTSSGEFFALVPDVVDAPPPLTLGAPVVALDWSERGEWIVAAGAALFRISRDGAGVVGQVAVFDDAITDVAVTGDGTVVAAVVGTTVHVYELVAGKLVGELRFRRAIGGVAFAAGATLGIGFDDGDMQRIDLLSGQATRSEPHPGRGRNVWNYEAQVDFAAIRGAIAAHRAGGGPIARFVPTEKGGSGGRWMWIGLGVTAFTILCCGCGGTLGALRFYGYL